MRKPSSRLEALGQTSRAFWERQAVERWIAWVLGAATIAVMVSHLATLTSYPPIFGDEAWYADAAWNWLKTGMNYDTMHSPDQLRTGYEWVRWPLLGNAPYLVSFAILGLGYFQARLVSWVFGALLLLVTFLVGRRTYGALTGVLAVLLLSLSPPFIQASRYARPDIFLAVVVMVAYGLVTWALERNRWWAHLLAGLLLGLALDIHFNTIPLGLGLGVLYLAVYRRRLLRMPGTWLFAGGVLLGVAYYAAVHILPNPAIYVQEHITFFGTTHALPIEDLSVQTLLWSIRGEIARYDFYTHSLAFGVIGASMAYLLVRGSRQDRNLLTFVGAVFVSFVLLVRSKHSEYAILLYPFFMLVVAEAFVSLVRARKGFDKERVFAAGLLTLFLLSSVQHYHRALADHRGYDYYAITDQIGSVIPEGARVMGMPHWWFGLSEEYDYVSGLTLTFYHRVRGYDLNGGLEALRPDYVIVDIYQWGLLVDENPYPPGPGLEVYNLPKAEFVDFLATRGEKVLEIRDPWHVTLAVYAIDWE